MRLNTHLVKVTTTYADLSVGDRVRAGAVGLGTVKKTLTRDGKVLFVVGKPGWVAGRAASADPAAAVTVLRPDTYIRATTDDGVQVLDLADPKSEFEVDGGCRYATTCTTHSILVTHRTLALAKRHAVNPSGWCENHNDGNA